MTASKFAEPVQTDNPAGIGLTADAAVKVKGLLEQEGRDDLRLRVAVQPGGCSGLRYQLFFDERSLDGDTVSAFDGFEVVVDRMCVPYLPAPRSTSPTGSTQQGFTIDNPNAAGLLRLRRLVPLTRTVQSVSASARRLCAVTASRSGQRA